MLTAGQLDEAELEARLVLNQLHADAGEEIELARGAFGIQVNGLVDTERRKRELQDRLNTLAHVTASLSSIEKMKTVPSQASNIGSVKVAVMQAHTTPLEIYYLEHGHNVDSLSRFSRQLFSTAFTVDLESKTIDDLQRRFSQRDGMSLIASAALADLVFTHKHNLMVALQREEELLAETGLSTSGYKTNKTEKAENQTLINAAGYNLALTKELALGNGDGRRPAELIVAEMAVSLKDMHRTVREIQVVSPSFTSLNKKK
jgi:hypothetical protein